MEKIIGITPQNVSQAIRQVSDKLNDIADSIDNKNYNPNDWKEIAEMFAPISLCLMIDKDKFINNKK